VADLAGHETTPLCPSCGDPLTRRPGEFFCAGDGFVLRDGEPTEAHAGVAEVGAAGTQVGDAAALSEAWREENGDGLD